MLPFKGIYVKMFQITAAEKYRKFVCLYRSPIQTYDKFQIILKNFELTLEKIHESNTFVTTVLEAFNAKSVKLIPRL